MDGALFPKTVKRWRSQKSIDKALDTAENAKVPVRSEGRCEVAVMLVYARAGLKIGALRCDRPATQIHHMIGGRGKRGRGISVLAEHKQHVCDECHLGITGDLGGKRLKRIGGPVPHYTDVYERVR